MTNQQLGKLGEDMAADYLEQKGFLILRRNFMTRRGEVDIIAAEEHSMRVRFTVIIRLAQKNVRPAFVFEKEAT